MAEQEGNIPGSDQDNESTSDESTNEDVLQEEETQTTRDGQGATGRTAVQVPFLRYTFPPKIKSKKTLMKEQRRGEPERLFLSKKKNGNDDKYQFYTEDVGKWRKRIKTKFGENTEQIASYKYETEIGTIMLYHNGECVIHVTDQTRAGFPSLFEEMLNNDEEQDDQNTENQNDQNTENQDDQNTENQNHQNTENQDDQNTENQDDQNIEQVIEKIQNIKFEK
ncbi:probable ATP-dependent helicase PF08_0048 [Haplochromis burtoni]|uniref:probable ATP-dependent helicase PF08_0048 n=1 Tax=Haplochromis burtoni TaxID=8153 RepID=UPI0003BCAFF1|nr:probable ATP-dependent helicase PF08_0048 [Haplochromis burtoni]